MNDSFQDPVRTIPKLHLSANKNVSDEQAAVNKATGYTITDDKTPIIGDWCRKVMSLTKLDAENLTREEIYKCSMAWPQANVDAIRDEFCKILNITGAELEAAIQRIKNVKDLQEFPTLVTLDFKHKLPAVIGSELVGPTQRKSEEETNEQNKPSINNSGKSSQNNIGSSAPIQSNSRIPRSISNRSGIRKIDSTAANKQQPNPVRPRGPRDNTRKDLQPIAGPAQLSNPVPPPRGVFKRRVITKVVVHPSPECLEVKNKPTPSKSKKLTKSGEIPAANISNNKSNCKKRKRRDSKKKESK